MTTETYKYQCAICKSVFLSGWTDEEADEERERDFPGLPKEECAIVCDDCYKQVTIRRENDIDD